MTYMVYIYTFYTAKPDRIQTMRPQINPFLSGGPLCCDLFGCSLTLLVSYLIAEIIRIKNMLKRKHSAISWLQNVYSSRQE